MQQESHHSGSTDALERDDPGAIRAFVETAHAADVATLIETLPPSEAQSWLLTLPIARRAATFGYLRPEIQDDLAQRLERRQLAAIVSEMASDERADLFNRLSPEQQESLLPGLASAEREDIRRLAAHEEGTVGAIMTSDYATLTTDLTAREAIEKLRREAPDKETIYRTYVTDADRRLLGSVRLQDLILARPDTRVAALMDTSTPSMHVEEDQEEMVRQIARYDVLALPVVDAERRLVGIVTHDDALDVLQEEATEDFYKSGTVGKIFGNVRDASVGLLYRKRVLWLVLLVFGNLFSGMGIAIYEDTIAAHLALIFFLPLLIASAGNAGSQASTLMVRALATGDVVMRDWAHVLGRELLVALGLGMTMAMAVSLIGLMRGGPEIALVVALTMVLVVIVGSAIGMSLPFLLSRFNLDPATASGPLVTSIADASGVLIYFAIASAILLT